MAKGGRDTTQKKTYTGRGDTVHTLLRWEHRTYHIGVGTPHIAYLGGDTAHCTYLIGVGTLHCTYLIGVGTLHIPYWGGDTAQY